MAQQFRSITMTPAVPRDVLPHLDMVHSSHVISERFNNHVYRPREGGSYTPSGSNVIRIPISGSSHADFLSHKLYFTVEMEGKVDTALDGTYEASQLQIPETAMGIFEKCVIKSRGTRIIEVENFDKLNQLFSLTLSSDFKYSHPWEAYKQPSSKDIINNKSIYTYTVEDANNRRIKKVARMQGHLLLTGFMASEYLMPLSHLDLEIELTIAPTIGRIIKHHSALTGYPTLTVSDVEFVMDSYRLSDEYEMAMNKVISEGGIRYRMQSYYSQSFDITSSNMLFRVPFAAQSVTGIMGSFVLDTMLDDAAVQLNFRSGTTNAYLKEMDLTIGTKNYESQLRTEGTNNFGEFMDNALEFFQNFRDYDSGWSQQTAEWYPTTAFIWGWDLMKRGDGSGIDTTAGKDALLRFKWDASPTASINRCLLFMRHEFIFVIRRGKNEIALVWERQNPPKESETGVGLVNQTLSETGGA